MSNKKVQNEITTITHGEVQAVVVIEEVPIDGYRYPTFRLQRACQSRAGKPLAPRPNFFDYSQEDLLAVIKEAASVCKRYQQNPSRTLKEYRKRPPANGAARPGDRSVQVSV